MNYDILQELYHKYDNKGMEKWSNTDVFDRIGILAQWCKYEDWSVSDVLKSVAELEELFKFVRYGVGVEFVSSVYEVVDEDIADGDYQSRDMVKMFNKAMGRKII